jgi:hypothetical protein
MLKNILTATRAHYAALQHRASPDRLPLHYNIGGVLSGTIQVKADTLAKQRRELSKLSKRLAIMYPESTEIEVSFI